MPLGTVEEAEAEKAVTEAGAAGNPEEERPFASNFDALDAARPNPSDLHKQKVADLTRVIEDQVCLSSSQSQIFLLLCIFALCLPIYRLIVSIVL